MNQEIIQLSDDMTVIADEYADEDGTGTCSKCGGQCMDYRDDVPNVGNRLGDDPVCQSCAEEYN